MHALKRFGAKNTLAFLAVIYSVGLAGLIHPTTRSFTASLTVPNLLLAFGLLVAWEYPWPKRRWLAASIPFAGGFFAEWLGVHTGLLFGNYHYGAALGWKWQGIPIMIGVNWVMMVWMTQALWHKTPGRWRPFLGAATMTAYDLLLEQVAIRFDYWTWHSVDVPMYNYLCWFLLSLFFHASWQGLSKPVANPIARGVFVLQALFFALLNLAFILWPKLGF